MTEDNALLGEYLSECEELLDALLEDLDALISLSQSNNGKGAAPKAIVNTINRVFRAVHSLKGLVGMMGLVDVQSVTHEMEDVLDDLRLGKLKLDRDAAAALQEAGAGLAELVGKAARQVVIEDEIARFQELLTKIASRGTSRLRQQGEGPRSLGLSERERNLLTELEEHRIEINLKAGMAFYALSVSLPATEVDARYRAMAASIDDLGELITALPVRSSKADSIGFKLVLATQLKDSDVQQAVKQFKGQLERLESSRWRRAGRALKSVGRIQKKSEADLAAPLPVAHHPMPASSGLAGEALQPLLASVRVKLSQVDDLSSLAHELAIETGRLSTMAERFAGATAANPKERFELKQGVRRIERQFLELEERLVGLRMVSLTQTFTRAARLTSRIARELGKSVAVELSGRTIQLDKTIVDGLADPIHHILRNAIDHGIEPPNARRLAGKPPRGRIKIEARLEGARAIIALSDDGRGIDLVQVMQRALEIGAIADNDELSNEETLKLILRPGFSTATEISAVSGRGVGLDVVERKISVLGGEMRVFSEKDKGSRFEVSVPTTLQMISAFIVRAGKWRYAINVSQIAELIYIDQATSNGKNRVRWQHAMVPVVALGSLLGLADTCSKGSNDHGRIPVVISRVSEKPVAVAVERFEGQREIIVKSLGSIGVRVKGVIGAVDLEGGDVALVLDLPGLFAAAGIRL